MEIIIKVSFGIGYLLCDLYVGINSKGFKIFIISIGWYLLKNYGY